MSIDELPDIIDIGTSWFDYLYSHKHIGRSEHRKKITKQHAICKSIIRIRNIIATEELESGETLFADYFMRKVVDYIKDIYNINKDPHLKFVIKNLEQWGDPNYKEDPIKTEFVLSSRANKISIINVLKANRSYAEKIKEKKRKLD